MTTEETQALWMQQYDAIDQEFETGPARVMQRQADDAPAQVMGLALQRPGDLLMEGRGCMQAREADAEEEHAGDADSITAPRQRDASQQPDWCNH